MNLPTICSGHDSNMEAVKYREALIEARDYGPFASELFAEADRMRESYRADSSLPRYLMCKCGQRRSYSGIRSHLLVDLKCRCKRTCMQYEAKGWLALSLVLSVVAKAAVKLLDAGVELPAQVDIVGLVNKRSAQRVNVALWCAPWIYRLRRGELLFGELSDGREARMSVILQAGARFEEIRGSILVTDTIFPDELSADRKDFMLALAARAKELLNASHV